MKRILPTLLLLAVVLLIPRFGYSQYCTPTSSYSTHYIQNVELGGMVNASSNATYTFYSQKTAQISTGNKFCLKFRVNSSTTVAAWIDYNKNDTFESGEKLGEAFVSSIDSFCFTVPGNANVNGKTRLRIRTADIQKKGKMDPCSWYSISEAEDYYIEYVFTASGSGTSTR